MSSSDTNCIETACYNCMEPICTRCTDQCTANCQENCEQNCNESCNAACQNACSSACSNACSNMTCTCGSSDSNTIILGLMFNSVVPFIGALLLGLIQAFDPSGPLFMTLLGSGVLAISLTGMNLTRFQRKLSSQSKCNYNNQFSTKVGFLTFNHSHHPVKLIREGHEFTIKKKYFCTGCYGLLAGTLIAIIFSLIYVFYGLSEVFTVPVAILIPFSFAPIIIRYTFVKKPSTSFRIISNGLLPIGCCLTLLLLDSLFHSWTVNVFIVILISLAAYLRGIIARRDNRY